MHPRLGGGRDPHNRRAVLDKSPAHILSFDLVSMVVSMLPASLGYVVVRRHGQERRRLARGPCGRLRSSTRPCGGAVSLDGIHKAQAVKLRKGDRRQVDKNSGETATMRGSKSKPRRRRPRKHGDDTGITFADMHKAQTAAVAAAAAGEVVRVHSAHVDMSIYWGDCGMQGTDSFLLVFVLYAACGTRRADAEAIPVIDSHTIVIAVCFIFSHTRGFAKTH